jgi:hypothetical protein
MCEQPFGEHDGGVLVRGYGNRQFHSVGPKDTVPQSEEREMGRKTKLSSSSNGVVELQVRQYRASDITEYRQGEKRRHRELQGHTAQSQHVERDYGGRQSPRSVGSTHVVSKRVCVSRLSVRTLSKATTRALLAHVQLFLSWRPRTDEICR